MDHVQELSSRLAARILWAMLIGVVLAMVFRYLPLMMRSGHLVWVNHMGESLNVFVTSYFMTCVVFCGDLFIRLIKMLVVPLVFVSLVVGSSSIGSGQKLGRVGIKALLLYIVTTALAISIALSAAVYFDIGHGVAAYQGSYQAPKAVAAGALLLQVVPDNPISSLSEGHMLQIVVFALLLGLSMRRLGDHVKVLRQGLEQLNSVLIQLILMIMSLAPYGVFCVIFSVFSESAFDKIVQLAMYFMTVVFVLCIQAVVVYSVCLRFLARLSPIVFYRKMRAAMSFAFSVSSSSASIPLVLQTVKERLGVKNSIAAFIIPLGATVNMDGTAIMQGVATVFIAHLYQIPLGLTSYLTVIAMATLASIGTAGVPGVGLMTLAMVLQQLHIPVEGIALILGVDRLLDMMRTAVNVAGDAMIACVIGRSEKMLDRNVFES